MSYRASVQESTGCTPNLLFINRETNLVIDLMVGMPWQMRWQYSCEIEYVEWVRNTVRASYSYAWRKLKTNAHRQKSLYDQRAKPHLYKVGKFVWQWYVPAVIEKLSCGWTGPWKIVAKPSDINCEIQKTPDGTRVRVHIDALKPYWGEVPELRGEIRDTHQVGTGDSASSPSSEDFSLEEGPEGRIFGDEESDN